MTTAAQKEDVECSAELLAKRRIKHKVDGSIHGHEEVTHVAHDAESKHYLHGYVIVILVLDVSEVDVNNSLRDLADEKDDDDDDEHDGDSVLLTLLT